MDIKAFRRKILGKLAIKCWKLGFIKTGNYFDKKYWYYMRKEMSNGK